jgi:hypothetical protein
MHRVWDFFVDALRHRIADMIVAGRLLVLFVNKATAGSKKRGGPESARMRYRW